MAANGILPFHRTVPSTHCRRPNVAAPGRNRGLVSGSGKGHAGWVGNDHHQPSFGAILSRISDRVWLAGLLTVLAIGQWLLVSTEFGHFHDPTVYLAGAESLATSGDYRFEAHEGRPAIGLYPPMHSFFLSLGWRMWPRFPENLALLRWGIIGLSLGAMAASFLVMRRLGTPLGLTLGFCVNAGLGMRWMEGVTWMMSDAAMMALLLGSAAAWLGWEGLGSRRWAYPLTGLVLAVAVGWRTAAVGAVLGAGLVMLAGGLKNGGLGRFLWVTGPPAMLTVGWAMKAREGVAYGGAYRVILEGAGGGLTGYGRILTAQLMEVASGRPLFDAFLLPLSRSGLVLVQRMGGVGWVWIVIIAGMAWWILGHAMRGMIWSREGRERVVMGGMVGYLLMAFAAPNGASSVGRYFVPLVPLVIGFAWRSWSTGRSTELPGRVAAMGLMALMLAIPLNVRMSWSAKRYWDGFHDLRDLRAFAEWVGTHVEPGGRIAMDWSLPVMHFRAWSGRRVVADGIHTGRSFTPVRPPEGMPGHVVISTEGWDRYEPPAEFERVHVSPGGKYLLYRVPAGFRAGGIK